MTNDSTMVVYKKASLDQVVALLDQLSLKGEAVKNAQIITGIVQILQTQGVPQEVSELTNSKVQSIQDEE